ncbi:MAG: c-type cytochrome [Leptospirillum sp.]
MSPITPPMKNSTAIGLTALFALVAFGILISLPEKKVARESSQDLSRVFPLASGKTLFEESCVQCHTLPVFSTHTPDQWKVLVKKMNRYMEQTGKKYLSADETDAVTSYILSNTSTKH